MQIMYQLGYETNVNEAITQMFHSTSCFDMLDCRLTFLHMVVNCIDIDETSLAYDKLKTQRFESTRMGGRC